MRSIFDENKSIYAASETAIKIIEETNSPLVYYKDAVFSVENGAISFKSNHINNFIKRTIYDKVSQLPYITINKDVYIKAKFLGYTKITALTEIYNELYSISTKLSYNKYIDFGYSYGSFYSSLISYIKKLVLSHLKDSDQEKYNLTTASFDSLPKSINNVITLKDFDNDFKEVKRFKKLKNVLSNNTNFIKAFNDGYISLKKLNSLINLKIN
jgi:hypothetical protein